MRTATITAEITDCLDCPHSRYDDIGTTADWQDWPLCCRASGCSRTIDDGGGVPAWCPFPTSELLEDDEHALARRRREDDLDDRVDELRERAKNNRRNVD